MYYDAADLEPCEECDCSPEPCSVHDQIAYALYLEWALSEQAKDARPAAPDLGELPF
jgi:hypothetical protein